MISIWYGTIICIENPAKPRVRTTKAISKFIVIKNTKYVFRKNVIIVNILAAVKWDMVYAAFGKRHMKI